MIKSYEELILIEDFIGRYEYLKIGGTVGQTTFAHNRWMNQAFYKSDRWRRFRRDIILRDKGFDLGLDGYQIGGRIIVHHINPISERDFMENPDILTDPNNAICVSHNTHEAIHYGDKNLLAVEPIIRKPGDTIPWR